MESVNLTINYKKSDSIFHIYGLGDIHAGTIHCVEHDVKRKVQEIKKDKNAYWVGMGDMAEFITPSDPRWDGGGIAPWVDKEDIGYSQEQWVIETLKPIKDKCLGMLFGNHENSIWKHSHQNVHKHICDGLGVTNLGYSCFLLLHFNLQNSNEKHLIKGALTHGPLKGNAVTPGAKINNLWRFMTWAQADFYAYGHVHDYIPKSFTRLGTNDAGQIKNKVAIGATTGSWFRTYTQGIQASYGEMSLYPPNELCCAMFSINPNTGYLDVSRSI